METTIAFQLPKEIWNIVLSYYLSQVKFAERVQLILVCKTWKTLVTQLTTEVSAIENHAGGLDQVVIKWPYLQSIHLPRYGAGLSSLNFSDIVTACLQSLSYLRSLVLVYKPNNATVNDYDVVATLTQLTHLTGSAYTKDADLLKLSTLTNLVSLDLGSFGYAYSMTSEAFDALKGMTRLTYFYTPNSGWNIECSEKMSHLTNLKKLNIGQGGSSAVFVGASILTSLGNLEQAIISVKSIPSEEIKHMQYWTNLTSLNIHNLVSGEHFDYLSTLTRLRNLTLSQFRLTPNLFVTLAKCPNLQKINFRYDIRWKQPNVDINDQSDELDDPWDDLAALKTLTSLRKIHGLPYHPSLNTRMSYFPQNLANLWIEDLTKKAGDQFFNSLTHFTSLKTLWIKGAEVSITNSSIECLARLTALRHLTIESDRYDYYSYRAWKNGRNNTELTSERLQYLDKYKYKCYSELNLSAFSCLTQLNTLYVAQDPFEEDELFALTTLTHLRSISFGWYFGMKDYRQFFSLPQTNDDTEDESDNSSDE